MKVGKYSSIYALASQGIFSMIVFAAGGFCIGYFAIDSILWSVILAIVGLLIGLALVVVIVGGVAIAIKARQ